MSSQKVVGFTCGAFDILHAGHAMMLKEAKQSCDYLIVGVQGDPSIDRPEKKQWHSDSSLCIQGEPAQLKGFLLASIHLLDLPSSSLFSRA